MHKHTLLVPLCHCHKGRDSKKTSSGVGQGWELREILRALQTLPKEIEN